MFRMSGFRNAKDHNAYIQTTEKNLQMDERNRAADSEELFKN